MALFVVVFIVGLFAAMFGSALHFSFAVMAAQYGLLLAGLLFGIPIIGDRDVLIRAGGGAFLGLAFSLFVWAATQSAQIFIVSGLMFGILAGLGACSNRQWWEQRDAVW